MNARLRALLAKRRATPERLTLQRVAAFGIAESIHHTTPPSSPRRRPPSRMSDRLLVAAGWVLAGGLLFASLSALLPA
jgi:hypothetical protein